MPIQSLHTKSEPSPKTHQTATPPSRRHAKYWWKIGGSIFLTIIVFVGVIGYRILASVNTTTNGNQKISVLTQLTHLVSNSDVLLKGEDGDRVNVLLLGIGGQGHDGPLLTDTIILASVKPSTGQVGLLSIPRDLAVEIPKYGIRKINNAVAFGEQSDYPGGGNQLAVDIVSRVTGQTIPYFARVDFEGFRKIVNDLGGITVNVETAFTDYEYPDYNYGYQTVSFKVGEQAMNGERALQFARSRHGTNGEGSDFSRSRRQQLVLEAIRAKAFSVGTILNPVKIGSVLSSLGTHTRTNMEVWELLRLSRLVKSATGDAITNRVLDTGTDGPLRSTTGLDGAYLLQPKAGLQNFTAVQAIAASIFDFQTIEQEAATIEIFNASGTAGAAAKIAEILSTVGFAEPEANPARLSTRANTTIIDRSSGMKVATLRQLRAYFGISPTQPPITPLDLDLLINNVNADANQNANAALVPAATAADIVIVLGEDVTDVQLANTKPLPSS